jgi:hypothetical protein
MTRSYRWWPLFVFALGASAPGCSGTATPSVGTAPPQQASRPVGARAHFKEGTTLSGGEVDFGQEREYTFHVANAGQSDLQLTLARKSCTCAGVDMPADPIPPGGEGKVVVHWGPIVGGEDNVVVHLTTNDEQAGQVDLTVRADLKPLAHIFVDGEEKNSYIDFGDAPILPNQPRTREVKVFSTDLAAFALKAGTPVAGLAVVTKPLPAGGRLGKYVIRSGYSVEITAGDKLPLGYLRTTLDLALSGLGDQPNRTLTIPVYAVVGSGAFAVTPELLLFQKPHITDEATAKVHLFINSSEAGAVTVESWEPKFLKVDVPEKELSGKWLIAAHLPKDNAEAAKHQPDQFMEGKVVLKAAGLGPITIRVKWKPLAE